MKKILFLIPIVALTGCTSIKATGPGWTLNTSSWLWDRANVSASVATNGITSFHEDTSTPDQQAISTLTSAVVGLAASAAK